MPVKISLLIISFSCVSVYAQLTPVVTEHGYVNWSIDALGTDIDGIIQVDKPENATVRSAYLVGASYWAELKNGDVTIDGSPVVWLRSIRSNLSDYWNEHMWDHWADVTTLIKPKIDASAPGLIDFVIVEEKEDETNGVILAVVFDDPNQTVRNTVVLFFGSQKGEGDTFHIRHAGPIDLSDPNLRLDFSLGIQHSLQQDYDHDQYSIVDVNGKRLTTAAGGQDDGYTSENGNGGAITVGGIGDSTDNPADPYAKPNSIQTFRSDDELYNLIPFVEQGVIQTRIFTQNPRTNDEICFAALFSSVTSIVGEGVLLTPVVDTLFTGTTDTLTATVQDNSGTPMIGRRVIFEIVSGPHAGLKDTCDTDSSGKALFIYHGSAFGLDEIVATMTESYGASMSSNYAYHYWKTIPVVADAGSDHTVFVGPACDTVITLDGTGSNDPDGGAIVLYTWLLPSGTTVTGATPTVTLPVGIHPIVLTVVDDDGNNDKDTVIITVVNRTPVLGVLSDTTIDEGVPLHLVFTASDSDGTVPRITASGLPAGAAFTDSANGTAHLFWNADCIGNCVYTVTLTASDCMDSTKGSFLLTIRDIDNPLPVIKHASFFSDNGRGSVNRVEIRYHEKLDTTGIPDSIRICWPDSSQCRMVQKSSITQDQSDKAHLTVMLPEPFPEGITRYNGWNGNLGLAYYRDPASTDEHTVEFPFAITDSVGPLITSAVLVERLTAGDDTLVITFSEWIDFSVVTGQCLTLLKNDGQGGFTEVPLTVVSAYPDADGYSIVAVVSFTTEVSAPKVGDSLRITATGPITDGSGNRAHELNRPVLITARRNPPDIVQAVYGDCDADGMVETVRIIFNKSVNLDSMQVDIEWNGSTGFATAAHFTRVGTGAGGDTVDVSMRAPLFSTGVLKDNTSGPMYVTVTFSNYESDNIRTVKAEDAAAPVLSALRYHFGAYVNESSSAPDTVYAKFSESLAEMPSAGQPFLFQDAEGQEYIVSVDNPALRSLDTAGNGERENYYRFIVTEVTADPAPAIGDSSWINTTVGNGIIDAAGNVQDNGNNKRVAVYIRRPPLHLRIVIGPNPFTPVSDQVGIRITARPKVPAPVEYRVCADVYDKVGNLVKRFPGDMMNSATFGAYLGEVGGRVIWDGSTWYLVTSDSVRIWWDGTNRNGRIVADGTYLTLPVIFYTTEGQTEVEYPRKSLLIGVKR